MLEVVVVVVVVLGSVVVGGVDGAWLGFCVMSRRVDQHFVTPWVGVVAAAAVVTSKAAEMSPSVVPP